MMKSLLDSICNNVTQRINDVLQVYLISVVHDGSACASCSNILARKMTKWTFLDFSESCIRNWFRKCERSVHRT